MNPLYLIGVVGGPFIYRRSKPIHAIMINLHLCVLTLIIHIELELLLRFVHGGRCQIPRIHFYNFSVLPTFLDVTVTVQPLLKSVLYVFNRNGSCLDFLHFFESH